MPGGSGELPLAARGAEEVEGEDDSAQFVPMKVQRTL